MCSQRKMRVMYDAMKTAVDENPDEIAKLRVSEGAFMDISKNFNRDSATIGLNITPKHCKTINKRGYYSVCADAENLLIEENHLGAMFLFDVIKHFYDVKVLGEINRILKMWGRCCPQHQTNMRYISTKKGCISKCT